MAGSSEKNGRGQVIREVIKMDRIHERYYLSYPRALIKEPILYQLV